MQKRTESHAIIRGTDLMPVMAEGVSSHIFEDQLLIFSERQQKLYAFNDSAAFIWLCQENRMSFSELGAALARTYGIDKEQAHGDLVNAFTQWCAMGLARVEGCEEQDAEVSHADPDIEPEPGDVCPTQWSDTYYGIRVSLAGSEFLIRCASPYLIDDLTRVWSHLESRSGAPARMVDLVENHGGYRISAPDVPVVTNIQSRNVIPVVTQIVLHSAYKNRDLFMAVHAAVLALGDCCVILPGQSGNGKSTLAAALIKNGFTYLTDEIALLDRDTHKVIPIPVSLRVKESGWDIVRPMFPHFDQLPYFLLSDGQRLRYLPPPAGSYANDPSDRFAARWLVFPRYLSGSKTAMSAISRVDAISRLQAIGFGTGRVLDRAKIVEILSWLKTVDCYEMDVNQLEDAVLLLRRLMD